MDNFTLKEKLMIISFQLSAFLIFVFLSFIVNEVVIGIIIWTIFCIVNVFIPEKSRLHADKLRHCFVLSILFLFVCVLTYKLALHYMDKFESIVFTVSILLLGNFITSNMLWWNSQSNYQSLKDFVKYNPTDKELVKYEEYLKDTDRFRYCIFMAIFRENKSWDKVIEELDIANNRTLDKEIYAIYSSLEYVLRLRK